MPQAILNSHLQPATGPTAPDMADLILWFRSDTDVEAAGITPVDGGVVDFWGEKLSGVANAEQATAAWQPTYHTGQLNGHPAIRFNPTVITSNFSQHMRIANADLPAALSNIGVGEYSIFVVYKPANFTNTAYLFSKSNLHTNSQIPVLQVQQTTGNIEMATGGNVISATSGPTVATWTAFGFSRSQSNAAIQYFMDGLLVDSDALFAGSGDNVQDLFVGARADGNTLGDAGAVGMAGDIAEILVYNFAYQTALSTANNFAYLAARYGL